MWPLQGRVIYSLWAPKNNPSGKYNGPRSGLLRLVQRPISTTDQEVGLDISTVATALKKIHLQNIIVSQHSLLSVLFPFHMGDTPHLQGWTKGLLENLKSFIFLKVSEGGGRPVFLFIWEQTLCCHVGWLVGKNVWPSGDIVFSMMIGPGNNCYPEHT